MSTIMSFLRYIPPTTALIEYSESNYFLFQTSCFTWLYNLNDYNKKECLWDNYVILYAFHHFTHCALFALIYWIGEWITWKVTTINFIVPLWYPYNFWINLNINYLLVRYYLKIIAETVNAAVMFIVSLF